MHKRVIKGLPSDGPSIATMALRRRSRIIPNAMAALALDPIVLEKNGMVSERTRGNTLVLERGPEDAGNPDIPRRFPRTVHELDELLAQKAQEIEDKTRGETSQAYLRGLDEGRSQGYANALGQIERIEKTLNAAKDQIITGQEANLTQFGEHLGRLALILAETIIGRAAAENSGDILRRNLERCLEALKGSGRVVVRISPIDYEFVREHTRVLEDEGKGQYTFEFDPDPAISPGGCYLETDGGAVDGRLESQLELLKSHFLQLI